MAVKSLLELGEDSEDEDPPPETESYEWTAEGIIPEELRGILGHPSAGDTVTAPTMSIMQRKNLWEDALDAGTVKLKEPDRLEVGMPVEALRRISDATGVVCSVGESGVVTKVKGGRVFILWARTKAESSIAEKSWRKYTQMVGKDVFPAGSRVRASADIVVGASCMNPGQGHLAVKEGTLGIVLETDTAVLQDGLRRIQWDFRDDGRSKPMKTHITDLAPGGPLSETDESVVKPVRFYLASGEELDVDLKGVQIVSDVKSRISESLGLDHFDFSVLLLLGCEVLEHHALWKDTCQVQSDDVDIMVVLKQNHTNWLEGFKYSGKPVAKAVPCHRKKGDSKSGGQGFTDFFPGQGELFRLYYVDGKTELVPAATLLPKSSGFFI